MTAVTHYVIDNKMPFSLSQGSTPMTRARVYWRKIEGQGCGAWRALWSADTRTAEKLVRA